VRSQIRQKRYQDRLVANYAASLSMALTDALTGLFNRRYCHGSSGTGWLHDRASRRRPLLCLMLDIDHFKLVNDTYGHAAGDMVLKEFGHRVSRHMRNFDLVARIGGEEFLVILPDVDLGMVGTIAERLCAVIADEPMVCTPDGTKVNGDDQYRGHLSRRE